MTYRVAIIDYGAGNIWSVQQAFLYLGAIVEIHSDPDRVNGFSHLILPGVGSFNRAMKLIKSRGIDQLLRENLDQGVPLLGICLGMQLLASRSSENGETKGLGFISGDVDRFDFEMDDSSAKIPHVGFDSVQPTSRNRLFSGLHNNPDFYFTHSFRMLCPSLDDVAAKSYHGEPYVSAVEKGLIAGTQFHPEKSQANGLKLLSNFLNF